MIKIFGYKIGITQIFTSDNKIKTVTILKVGPCFITQIQKNKIQIGYKPIVKDKQKKSILGHLEQKNLIPLKFIKEYKLSNTKKYSIGKIFNTEIFYEKQNISITGYSIGKGFMGTIKRFNFKKGPMSHGSKNHRKPGAIGQGTTPGRVFRGKKLAGHLGNNKKTIKNVKIVQINKKENLLIINGTIMGKPGNILQINSR